MGICRILPTFANIKFNISKIFRNRLKYSLLVRSIQIIISFASLVRKDRARLLTTGWRRADVRYRVLDLHRVVQTRLDLALELLLRLSQALLLVPPVENELENQKIHTRVYR